MSDSPTSTSRLSLSCIFASSISPGLTAAPSRASLSSKAPRQPWKRVCVSPPLCLRLPADRPCPPHPFGIPDDDLAHLLLDHEVHSITPHPSVFALLPSMRSYHGLPVVATSNRFKRNDANSTTQGITECRCGIWTPKHFPKPISTLVPGPAQTGWLSPPHHSTDSSQRDCFRQRISLHLSGPDLSHFLHDAHDCTLLIGQHEDVAVHTPCLVQEFHDAVRDVRASCLVRYHSSHRHSRLRFADYHARLRLSATSFGPKNMKSAWNSLIWWSSFFARKVRGPASLDLTNISCTNSEVANMRQLELLDLHGDLDPAST